MSHRHVAIDRQRLVSDERRHQEASFDQGLAGRAEPSCTIAVLEKVGIDRAASSTFPYGATSPLRRRSPAQVQRDRSPPRRRPTPGLDHRPRKPLVEGRDEEQIGRLESPARSRPGRAIRDRRLRAPLRRRNPRRPARPAAAALRGVVRGGGRRSPGRTARPRQELLRATVRTSGPSERPIPRLERGQLLVGRVRLRADPRRVGSLPRPVVTHLLEVLALGGGCSDNGVCEVVPRRCYRRRTTPSHGGDRIRPRCAFYRVRKLVSHRSGSRLARATHQLASRSRRRRDATEDMHDGASPGAKRSTEFRDSVPTGQGRWSRSGEPVDEVHNIGGDTAGGAEPGLDEDHIQA